VRFDSAAGNTPFDSIFSIHIEQDVPRSKIKRLSNVRESGTAMYSSRTETVFPGRKKGKMK